ncbi:MAG: serine hydrolase [bacterium]|nr:serine hydrolase [bacterium]
MKNSMRERIQPVSILYTLLTALLIFGLGLPVSADEVTDRVDKLFAQWDKKDSPGCALAVVKEGKIIYKRGYGMADLERDVPITSKSVFDIASTSKQFVAMSILLLEEKGKLSLDDDIRKYFPKFPDYGNTITIRHLIHHTSGIRDYLNLMYFADMPFANDYPEAQIVELIARQKELNFKPGDEQLYSNSGYFLLGEIVKRVSGKTLGEFAKESIFKPLGMHSTQFYDDFSRIVKNRAIGYLSKKKGGFKTELYLFDLVGDGGVLTSVEDFFLWDQNFYHNKLGKGGQELIRKMKTTGSLNSGKKLTYACGLGIRKHKGLPMVSHGGGWAGYRSEAIRFPQQGFSVICLSNLGQFDPTRMALKVADIYLENQFPENEKSKKDFTKKNAEPKTVPLSRSALKQKEGDYRNPKSGTIWNVTAKDGKLELKHPSGLTALLSHVGNGVFHTDSPVEIQATFPASGTSKGKIKGMQLTIRNDEPYLCEPIVMVSLTASELKQYAGTYYSEELEVTYHASVKESQLVFRLKYMEDPVKLSPTIKDNFMVDGSIATFLRNKDNRITGFSLNAGRTRNIRFVKQ